MHLWVVDINISFYYFCLSCYQLWLENASYLMNTNFACYKQNYDTPVTLKMYDFETYKRCMHREYELHLFSTFKTAY